MSIVTAQNDDGSRTIINGTDKYTIKKTTSFEKNRTFLHSTFIHNLHFNPRLKPTKADVDSLSFTTTDDQGNASTLTIAKLKNVENDHGYVPLCEIAISGHLPIELNENTDINDINSIRYQLSKINRYYDKDNAKRCAHFIDKFIIVTPKEKLAYAKYADKMKKEEIKTNLKQMIAKRKEENEAKEQLKQLKQQEKNKALEAAKLRKIKEKFTGNE